MCGNKTYESRDCSLPLATASFFFPADRILALPTLETGGGLPIFSVLQATWLQKTGSGYPADLCMSLQRRICHAYIRSFPALSFHGRL
jgi:hypothetical protein